MKLPHHSLCRVLAEKLRGSLPGRTAQNTMLPPGRTLTDRPPPGARHSAVLIALIPTPEGQVSIPLIQRTDDGGPHSGQIALPGGAREPGEDFPIATALREAEEEIGLPADRLTILGALTPFYISVSNFTIAPVVAYAGVDDAYLWRHLSPDPEEVALVLGVDPYQLRDSRADREVDARGQRFAVPSYRHEEHIIWGATALILAEFFAILPTQGA